MEASWALLTAAVNQYAKALVLCSRCRGLSQRPCGNLPLEGEPSPGEDDWDTLKREAATYEEGSWGCLPQTFW